MKFYQMILQAGLEQLGRMRAEVLSAQRALAEQSDGKYFLQVRCPHPHCSYDFRLFYRLGRRVEARVCRDCGRPFWIAPDGATRMTPAESPAQTADKSWQGQGCGGRLWGLAGSA